MIALVLLFGGILLIGSGLLWIAWALFEAIRILLFGTGPSLDSLDDGRKYWRAGGD